MALSEEACQLLRESGNHVHLLYALFTQAQAALFLKAIKEARDACRKALRLAQAQRQSYGIAASLGLIGGMAGIEERYAQAARLFGAAQALQERIQAPHPPAGRALLERMVLSIITSFGQENFLRHFAEGKSSSLEDILIEAEAILETPPASRTGGSPAAATEVAGLSPRELEVLVLVAKGLTDAQVARYLFLSTRTVSKHLQSIYARLGVNSRSAATRFAFEHGLV
jgi:DNA-binding NarL/FixJ family response regulator